MGQLSPKNLLCHLEQLISEIKNLGIVREQITALRENAGFRKEINRLFFGKATFWINAATEFRESEKPAIANPDKCLSIPLSSFGFSLPRLIYQGVNGDGNLKNLQKTVQMSPKKNEFSKRTAVTREP